MVHESRYISRGRLMWLEPQLTKRAGNWPCVPNLSLQQPGWREVAANVIGRSFTVARTSTSSSVDVRGSSESYNGSSSCKKGQDLK